MIELFIYVSWAVTGWVAHKLWAESNENSDEFRRGAQAMADELEQLIEDETLIINIHKRGSGDEHTR